MTKSGKKQNIQENGSTFIKERIEYSKDILEKRYQLYTWLDTKVNLSLVINTALLGFAYILIERSEVEKLLICQILIILAILFVGISVFFCLFLIKPAMKSPLWKKYSDQLVEKQPRTSIGIETFSPKEYIKYMNKISLGDMLQFNLDQILKMNRIVNNYSRRLKLIITLSASALVFLIITLLIPYLIKCYSFFFNAC